MDVRLSHHNWKLAACVESLKSIPMETVTEASGSRRSENEREGRRGRVSDKGTVCSVEEDGAKGERRKRWRWRRRRRRAAAEWNRQASTPLVFSTSQSKATVCEKSILQSHYTHL